MRTTIIIPTMCEARRREALHRAIGGLLAQQPVPPAVIVVINGNRVDASLRTELLRMAGVRVIEETVGSLPHARRIGREAVQTDYFGFLDDDEYLPGALATREEVLQSHPDVDVVVCNGLRHLQGQDEPFIPAFDACARAPLHTLAHSSWLASCGGLYRSATVEPSYFDERFKYLEWTLLGFKLATTRRLAFVQTPTFRIHDTPQSLSKSRAYELAHTHVLDEILTLPLPPEVRTRIRVKLGAAHHSLSDACRSQGDWRAAWRHHLKSLAMPQGWRYVAYSRRLMSMPSHSRTS